MSSQYQKLATIPEGFPELLKAFTREVLRACSSLARRRSDSYAVHLKSRTGAALIAAAWARVAALCGVGVAFDRGPSGCAPRGVCPLHTASCDAAARHTRRDRPSSTRTLLACTDGHVAGVRGRDRHPIHRVLERL
jgi:hypothetical protein